MTNTEVPDLESMSAEDLRTMVGEMARVRYHHLAPDMVNGTRALSPQAAIKVIRYLGQLEVRNLPDVPSCTREGRIQVPVQMTRPQLHRVAQRFQDIPAGFYATPSQTGNNDFDFWKVTVNDRGFRAVKRVLGGSDTPLPKLQVIGKTQQTGALGNILHAGIEASAALYAKLETRCSDCGRQLTDEESRRYGKGRVCREKNG
jgi:hypothetical protein